MVTYFIRCTENNIYWVGLQEHNLKVNDWLILIGEYERLKGDYWWDLNGRGFRSTQEIKVPKI